MTNRRFPHRTCIACRSIHNKSDLFRIVKDRDGAINLDVTVKMKMDGRGAYLCLNEECLKKAIKTGTLKRELGATDSEIGEVEKAIKVRL